MEGVQRVVGLCGDQNNDGVVNILDVITDLQVSADLVEPDTAQVVLSDLNQDGGVDVLDATTGLQHVVGKVPSLDVCGPLSP